MASRRPVDDDATEDPSLTSSGMDEGGRNGVDVSAAVETCTTSRPAPTSTTGRARTLGRLASDTSTVVRPTRLPTYGALPTSASAPTRVWHAGTSSRASI